MITGSPSLRALDVNGNKIGDVGLSLCLQHINTLTKLSVAGCGLSVEGSYCLLHCYLHNQLTVIL